jgi:hypothetical protein
MGLTLPLFKQGQHRCQRLLQNESISRLALPNYKHSEAKPRQVGDLLTVTRYISL